MAISNMINVLPEEYKHSLKKEFYARISIVGFLMIACTGIIFTVLLIPSYLLISTKAHAAETKLEGLKEAFALAGTPLASDTVSKINHALGFFSPTEPEITPIQLLDFISSVLPRRIVLDQIGISKIEKSYQVVLTGFADNRDALLSFSALLKKDPRIADVILPLSSFISNQNLQFSLTLTTVPI